jgi:hypothetical protein
MFSACAVLGTTAYYLFAWVLFGRDPKKRTTSPLYEPPRDLSPALMRYIWKEEFDDRTFWASALSIVAKGVATMEENGGQAILRLKANSQHLNDLSVEEEILLNGVTSSGKHRGISVNMLEGRTAYIVQKMADSLHKAAVGRWFRENRYFLFVGIALSAVTVVAIARPSNRDEWMAIVFGISIMTPAAFYLWLLLLRIKDMCRAAEGKIDIAIVKTWHDTCCACNTMPSGDAAWQRRADSNVRLAHHCRGHVFHGADVILLKGREDTHSGREGVDGSD